jgi:hypothetical protein
MVGRVYIYTRPILHSDIQPTGKHAGLTLIPRVRMT